MFKTHNLLSILIVIISIQNSYAQKLTSKIIDSTFIELSVKPNTTTKVDDLIELYKNAYKNKLTNEAILDEAIKVSVKLLYLKGLGESYDRRGLVARYNNDFSKSVTYHKRALNYLNKASDTLLIIKCLNNLGVSYRKLNLEKEAFQYYFQALDLSEKIKHERSITIALNGIGNVFIETKEYDKALYYFKKVYAFDLKNENIKGQEYSLSNIGEAYLYEKEYDSAYYYINKALQLTIEHKHKSSEAIRYNLLGLLFQKKGDYNKSTEAYKEAIPLFTKSNDIRYLSNTLINIGKNQLNTGDYKNAEENIKLGLTNAKIIKSKENISLGYNALVNYYTVIKDYKNALNAHKLATAFNDSILNHASQESIISTQIAYETAKKDEAIQKLGVEKERIQQNVNTSQNRLLYSILGSSGVVGVLVVLFFLYRKKSDLEIEQKNSELQEYTLQINKLKDKVSNNTSTTKQQFLEKYSEFDLSKREVEVLNINC